VRKMRNTSRFGTSDSLAEGTHAALEQHVAFELENLMDVQGLTQEELAHTMGFNTPSGASKIIGGHRGLTLQKARLLDDEGWTTTLGTTFEGLVREVHRSKNGPRRPIKSPRTFDVFLATPMATADSYKRDRELVLDLKSALERANLTVFYAGDDIARMQDFDTQDIAYATNWDSIQASRQLVLYLLHEPTSPKPSSIWVEVGMALALGLPCTFFVPSLSCLPYVVQRAFDEPGTRKKLVDVHTFEDNPRLAISRVRRNKAAVLAGGGG
jgi:hypothetical protein